MENELKSLLQRVLDENYNTDSGHHISPELRDDIERAMADKDDVKNCETCGHKFRPVDNHNFHCQACQPFASLDGRTLPFVTQRELEANKKIGWYADKLNIVKQVITHKPLRVRVVGHLKPLKEELEESKLKDNTVVKEDPQ